MTGEPPDEDRRFYGRRRGRRLRAGREGLLREELARWRLASEAEGEGAVDLRRAFDPPVRQVWLEIGFGAGEHLAWQAARHPDIGFVGAEPFLNGVASLLAQIRAEGLANIRILPDDVRPLLGRLAEASLARVFILFPDPWPKARHRRRRIVSRETLDALAHAMADGAELRLATDDQDYLVWMLRHLQDHPDFAWLAERAGDWRRRPADWPATRYEAKNRSGGPGPTFLRYRRRAREGSGAG